MRYPFQIGKGVKKAYKNTFSTYHLGLHQWKALLEDDVILRLRNGTEVKNNYILVAYDCRQRKKKKWLRV